MKLGPIGLALLAGLALSTGTALGALPSTLSSSYPSYVEPGAPGPYTGPGNEAIPKGWFGWNSASDDDVHHQCGKFKIVFRNPDLQEKADGWVYAQGSLLAQLQVVGPGSSIVNRLAFSFGVTTDAVYDNPTVTCNSAIPPNQFGQGTGGAYLLYYRSDWDPKDGFFINVITRNVPDGQYTAAVHAYDSTTNVEVARFWTHAIVKNCNGVSVPNSCPFDSPEVINGNDHTLPWPIVLPGDGEQTNLDENGAPIKGLTLEFPEPLVNDSVKASVNGQQVQLSPWNPPARDSDLQPNNDNQPCPLNQEIRYVCTRDVLGPGWKWLGEIKHGDAIQVEALDKNRNHLVKTVHFGEGTSGGTVDLLTPSIDVNVVNGNKVELKPGDFHEFNVQLVNLGNSEAHVNLLTEYTVNKGLTAFWTDLEGATTNHVVLPAGSQLDRKIKIESDRTMKPASFDVAGVAEYDAQGEQVQKKVELTVKVDPNAGQGHRQSHDAGLGAPATNATEAAGTDLDTNPGGKSPGFAATFGILALAGAVVWARRRT